MPKEKHAQRTPAPLPVLRHPFAPERAQRDIHALLEGHNFKNVSALAGRGPIPNLAAAAKAGDPKWQAQQLADDALEADDPDIALRLAARALDPDPDCVDAERIEISLLPLNDQQRIHQLSELVAKAGANLGEEFFNELEGHFRGVIETRPYMRLRQHLAELLVQEGRDADANQLLSRLPDDEGSVVALAWGRALERWLSAGPSEAGDALIRARKVNPYAEPYISGRKAIPSEGPSTFKPGDDSDAQVCAAGLAPAWLAHPGFRQWLRTQSNASL